MEILHCTCAEAGYDQNRIDYLVERVIKEGLDLHSLMLSKNGRIFYEEYYGKALGGAVEGGPNSATSMHRMYSITKSIVAIAIGLLVDEGKLALEDRLVDYYELLIRNSAKRYNELYGVSLHNLNGGAGCHNDDLGDNSCEEFDELLKNTTILDMLTMRSNHSKTTYKVDIKSDWVKSFFLIPSDKEPGKAFNYDTSASHVLGALVEAITGMDVMDYIRVKMPELGISARAHILYDPFGVEVGGSGLMCTPRELYRIARLIELNGQVDGRQLISADYLRLMTSKQVDNSNTAKLPFEKEGYGYYTWMTDRGFMFYGMLGQLVWFDPTQSLMAITTADTSTYPGITYDNGSGLVIPAGAAGGVQRLVDFIEQLFCTKR